MKILVLVCDGMADWPVEQIGDRTPLEAAKSPNMDKLVKRGTSGLTHTIPAGFTPASDVGNMSILGYDPTQYYSGRGPLEAANMGVPLESGDVAFRCNLITTDGDKLADYSAGHISSEEAATLIEHVDQRLGSSKLKFYPGIMYRHLAVFREPELTDNLVKTVCKPPHDMMGKKVSQAWPEGPQADQLTQLMEESRGILSGHEVNQVRIDLKENPGNMIWLWGQGKRIELPTLQQQFKLTGSVISAVDLVNGAGRLAGLQVITVPGATGYYDTNYVGKADYALKSLEENDFVFVHIEAADEAGHNGDLREKILAIENFDKHIVGRIIERLESQNEEYRVLVIPDHPTPVAIRTHTSDPVPFVVAGKGIAHNGGTTFGETAAKEIGVVVEKAHEILPRLITQDSF